MARLGVVALLCSLAASTASAQNAPSEQNASSEQNAAQAAINQQLAYLDPDAGLVISLRLEQLKAAHDLAAELIPEERQAINLAGLGASAILGFYPFDPRAWSASGFDSTMPLLVQVAATGPSSPFVRTRVVIKASEPAKAQQTVERMRLRDKVRPEHPDEALLPLLAKSTKRPKEAQLRKALLKAGVFLIARPVPLTGLLFAQLRDGYLILDLLDPAGQSVADALRTLQRQPGALTTAMPGAEALQEGPMAVWLRAIPLGAALRRLSVGEGKRSNACSAIAELGTRGSVQAVGLAGDIGANRVAIDIAWHLNAGTTLVEALETSDAPVLVGQGLLDAQIRLASWGRLRDRERPAQAQSWDTLWAQTRTCSSGASAYAVATSWPEMLGLFLSEVSALHPNADVAVHSLGAMSAQISPTRGEKNTIVTEAWVRGAGAGIAKDWLKILFGTERHSHGQTRWGLGAIQPYAIDREGGSIVGAGYRPGSRKFALTRTGRQRAEAAADTEPVRILARMLANPAQLAQRLSAVPYPHLWTPWKHLAAQLQASDHNLKFSLELRREDDR